MVLNGNDGVFNIKRNPLYRCEFFEQSCASCRELRRPSAICPGERMERIEIPMTNMGPSGSVCIMMGTEGWGEQFQDLQTWCQPPHLDELNTPQVEKREEFDFSNVCMKDEPSLIDNDPWGNDFFGNNYESSVGEENNNNTNENLTLMKQPTNSSKMHELFNLIPSAKPLLNSSSEDIVLTQYVLPQKTFDKQPQTDRHDVNAFSNLNETRVDIPMPKEVKKDRPDLKLNIPPIPINIPRSCTLNTPDSLPVLGDINTPFDLVSYLDSNPILEDCPIQVASQDHTYTGSRPIIDALQIKTEPPSPANEELNPRKQRCGKRSRKDSNSDYVYDSDDFSDESDYVPSPKNKRQKKKKEKQSRLLPVKQELDEEATGFEKYRELRDKNNEASRRSRYNRKQKDEEMKLELTNLERENIRLKAEAVRKEKLVEQLQAMSLKLARKLNKN